MSDVEAHLSSYWGARPTFAGVAAANLDALETPDVVIIGSPIDWGATYRPGARFGPGAIRHADYLGEPGRPHLPTGIDPFAELTVVDVGDLVPAPGYLEESLEMNRRAVARIVTAGAVPIVLGGDHSITYANASGLADVLGSGTFALVHFDAHADTAETHMGDHLYGHGTPMRRLVESGAVPGHRFAQIGLRGYWPGPDVVEWMRDQGMRWWLMTEIAERGLGPVIEEATAHVSQGADGVFLSVDIDVVDPGMAPGTGTPEPGGLTSRQLLDAVREISRAVRIVGADVVEVSPPYDGPGGITAFLANRVVLEVLNGIAERRLTAP